MAPVRDERPTTAAEIPLDTNVAICDSHHHLWERRGARYLLEDFVRDVSSGHPIVSTVAIECGAMYRSTGAESLKPIGETEFLESIAQRAAGQPGLTTVVAGAIVGYADLRLGDRVAQVLQAHMAASPMRFRGVRFSTTWEESGALRHEAPRGLLLDSGFRRGFACLGRYGLSFDAWVYHPQLHELASLARAFPDTTIILDHIGAPLGVGPYAGCRDEVFQSWSKGIKTVAACRNVIVKIGGFGSERSGYDWHRRPLALTSVELAQSIRPYVEFCLEHFGVRRSMFESNFPVEKRANAYSTIWNAFQHITASYSIDERQSLFHDTAERVYRPFVPSSR